MSEVHSFPVYQDGEWIKKASRAMALEYESWSSLYGVLNEREQYNATATERKMDILLLKKKKRVI